MLLLVIVTFGISFLIGWYAGRFTLLLEQKQNHLKIIKAIDKAYSFHKSKTTDNIKKKIMEATNITTSQLDLWRQIDTPNRNASHSKWKYDIMHQINDLEVKKIDIFRQIVKDGFDLTVKIIEANGGIINQKMSEVIAKYDNNASNNKPYVNKSQNETTNKRKPTLKLVKDTIHDR